MCYAFGMSDPVYTIHIIDDGEISVGVDCDDLQNDAEALNWAYFWLGRYRSDAARLYRADAEGNPVGRDQAAGMGCCPRPRICIWC